MNGRPEALLGDDNVAQLIYIPRCVDVIFPSDQVDFLSFDGDLNGFGAGHVGTAALDVLRDDLETLVLGPGQDVGADSLEREGDPVEGRVVRISRGSADGCLKRHEKKFV